MREVLRRYLNTQREAVLWKLEGLSERDARRPRTATGSNVLGIVKHLAAVELDYIALSFDRPHGLALEWMGEDAEPNADMFATAGESRAEIVELYELAARLTNEALDELPLDTPGRVPWWGDRGEVTLGLVIVHLIAETARHAGQLDILRETIDGAAGLRASAPNMPEPVGSEYWATYREHLTQIADGFGTA
ncbi:MAG: DinB family protein [bacterium]|nr:DinB family protein [bacterium]